LMMDRLELLFLSISNYSSNMIEIGFGWYFDGNIEMMASQFSSFGNWGKIFQSFEFLLIADLISFRLQTAVFTCLKYILALWYLRIFIFKRDWLNASIVLQSRFCTNSSPNP
jgi:hypothetical protein